MGKTRAICNHLRADEAACRHEIQGFGVRARAVLDIDHLTEMAVTMMALAVTTGLTHGALEIVATMGATGQCIAHVVLAMSSAE